LYQQSTYAKKQAKTEVRNKSFGLSVIDDRSRLPDEEKSMDRLRVFKKEIKKTVWSRNVKGGGG
jgi:hypothetical protein